jgi:hypothetical protein
VYSETAGLKGQVDRILLVAALYQFGEYVRVPRHTCTLRGHI